MRMFSRLLMIGAVAAGVALAGAGSAFAAEDGEGTVDLHFRYCPPGAVDVFADCHDNPIAGIDVRVYDNDGGAWTGTTDEDGNFSATVLENQWLYSWDLDVDVPSWDDYVLSYCSVEGGDGSDIEPKVGDTMGDWEWFFDVMEDDVVTCDIYFWNWDMDPIHGGAETPNTGAGPMTTGASAGFFLAGAVALGGLAVASRKRAFR